MSLTAFFSDDLLAKGSISDSSLPGAGTPVANVNDPRPRKVFQNGPEGCFEVTTGRQWIDLSETAPAVTVAIQVPVGVYTGQGLAQAIRAAIAATPGLFNSYQVVWSGGRFRILSVSAVTTTFSLLWNSGAHGSAGAGDSIGTLIGFRNVDLGPGDDFQAQDFRYSTHTFVRWTLDKSRPFHLATCQLYGDGSTSFINANLYVHSGNLGNRREVWAASASTSLSFSNRPGESENVIQIAWPASMSTGSQVFFSWEHIDESEVHQVGVVALLKKIGSTAQSDGSSASRTVTQLRGHGLLDDSQGLGVNSYYPARTLKRWTTPLSFDAWELADYRAVIHKLVRYGRQTPFVWALNWTDLYHGGRLAQNEADNGSLLWAAIQDYSLDDREGATSAYASGTLTIEQVR